MNALQTGLTVFALSLAGMAALSLAMERHYAQLTGGAMPTRTLR